MKVISKFGMLLGCFIFIAGVGYRQWYYSGPLRSLVEDQKAQQTSWFMILLGCGIGLTGTLLWYLHRSYLQVKNISDLESREHTRTSTLLTMKVVFLASLIHVFLWIPIFNIVQPGAGIRPMLQTPASFLMSITIMLAGSVEALKQFILYRPRSYGIATLVLSLVPAGLFLLTEWYLLSYLGVWYKP